MPNVTVTIVFRGLMVFNKQPNTPPLGTMEIGFVDALSAGHTGGGHASSDVHIPRILTMKDGVLAEVFDLRNRPQDLGMVRNWELVVTDPTQALQPLTTDEVGANFDRRSHNHAKDFRFITDFEANDLHNRPLSRELNTRQLLLVLYVHNGEFYTKLQSPTLRRTRVNGPPQPVTYGKAAAVVGLDITLADTGTVKLMAGGTTGVEIFNFTTEPGVSTLYEISNAPPDVPADAPTPTNAPGHFHMYYDKLFNRPPTDQFDLVRDDLAPAPDPALCGVGYMGLRTDPL